MSTTYIETEDQWDERGLPRPERASVTLSAWTTDEEIAAIAADRESVYGNRYDIDTVLRLARSQLRTAVLAVADTHERA